MAARLFVFFLVLSAFPSLAQTRTVTGTIGDASGPLPGVSITVKGTSTGTATDSDGKFSLVVVEGQTLIISYIGYLTQEVSVTSASNISITLEEDSKQLGEVVVVGYGTQLKREIVGSISKVTGEKLTVTPSPSFEAALQGTSAGVQVIQGSGLAGSGSIIRIRGVASVSAGADPLYVVDGIPITQDPFLNGANGAMNTNPLATINPSDIESVEILKDVSAAGIYGSRGANGVIIVTTKRGRTGKPAFNFTSRVGFSAPVAKPRMLNSKQYLQLYQEAYNNDGGVGLAPLPGGILWENAQNTNTDWWDLTTRTGVKQDYGLSMSQGSKKLATFVNLGYSDNQSYMVGNTYKRLSGRVNVDYNVLDNLKISASTSLSRGDNVRVNTAWAGGVGQAMSTALPIYPVTNADGSYYFNNSFSNPVRQQAYTDWHTIDTRSLNTLSVNYKPVKNLTVYVNGSLDLLKNYDDKWESSRLIGQPDSVVGQAYASARYVNNMVGSATAEYLVKTNSDHMLKVMAGAEYQQLYQRDAFKGIVGVNKPLFKNPTPIDSAIRSGDYTKRINVNGAVKFVSLFARLNYIYKDKYIAQATFRTDGSSKFGPENRYGFFPTAALGWVLSEEPFLKGNSFISFLKLKASYGKMGNSNIPVNSFAATYTENVPGSTGNGYNGLPILYPTRLANPYLKWETSLTLDLGFEFNMLNDRITTEFAYYNKMSSDVLMYLAVPKQAGIATNYYANVGRVLNTGVEFSFLTRNLIGDFKWTTEFNIARNRNEVRSVGNFSDEAVSGGTNDTRVKVGEPIGTNYLVRFSRVDPATGRPIYFDRNGQETFTWDPQDRVVVGNILPDFTGGITNTFQYKGFTLSFLFVFTKGGDIYDSSSKRQLGVITDWNMREDLFDRWRQPGDIARYPRLTLNTQTYGSGTPWINTDMWRQDGSYMRLRTLSLGYSLPHSVIEKLKLKSAIINVAGSNLLTFTKYRGLDPEIGRDFESPTDRNMSPNITYLTPPQEKSIVFSLNLGF